MMTRSVAQQRVENKRFFGTFGRDWSRLGAIGRIVYAGLAGALSIGIRRHSAGRIHGVRRQIEAALAAAAAKRERHCTQNNDSPSRRGQAQIPIHDEIPNAGRTIQRLVQSGETRIIMELQRNLKPQPNFRSFSSRFNQAFACASTFFGAVPPKLVRLFTEDSTDSTLSASPVIFG